MCHSVAMAQLGDLADHENWMEKHRLTWRKINARMVNGGITLTLAILAYFNAIDKLTTSLNAGQPTVSFDAAAFFGTSALALIVAIVRVANSIPPSGRDRIPIDVLCIVIAALMGLIPLVVSHIELLTYGLALATFLGVVVQDLIEGRS